MNEMQTALEIISELNRNGYKAYLVGGSVRDMCMNIPPHDFDIATSARPAEVKSVFQKTFDTGLKHGTVTVVLNNTNFEVTTFRTESTYQNHRKPEKVEFVTDITEDLKRRDFTINAMAYHPDQGIIDPFGGQEDLKKQIIRCVGNPETRFEEDALRMLRCVRFACKTNFSVHEDTLCAITKKRELLTYISKERIYDELTKALLSDHPEHLRLAHDTGLLEMFLPELTACFLTEQNTKYHLYNAGDHILKAVCATPKDKTVRFAALLHDIAKPQSKTTDASGQDHFKGHEEKSADLSVKILHRLKAENKLISDVETLIRNHRAQDYKNKYAVKKKIRSVGMERFPLFLELLKADTLAHNPEFNAPRLAAQQYLLNTYTEISENGEPMEIKDLALSGKDLIDAGFSGSEIGKKLDMLLDFVLQYPEKNTKEHLSERIKL